MRILVWLVEEVFCLPSGLCFGETVTTIIMLLYFLPEDCTWQTKQDFGNYRNILTVLESQGFVTYSLRCSRQALAYIWLEANMRSLSFRVKEGRHRAFRLCVLPHPCPHRTVYRLVLVQVHCSSNTRLCGKPIKYHAKIPAQVLYLLM